MKLFMVFIVILIILSFIVGVLFYNKVKIDFNEIIL